MDPSLSISSDSQHHPPPPPHPQFAGFPFSAVNPFAGAQSHPFFGGGGGISQANVASSNNHVFQAPPQQPPPPQPAASLPPHPSFNHPPYSDMICSAIAALNEPDGSSKQAISRYIERVYSDLPPAHGALLTHHLKTLKNSGVLLMVKKSYKFASTPPPTSVAVAAAAAAAGLEAARSDLPTISTNDQLDQTGLSSASSAPTAQKRGRGRPPKPKPEAQPQPQSSEAPVQPNGQSHTSWEQNDMSVSRPAEDVVQPTKRPRGRPKKNGAAAPTATPTPAIAPAAAGIMKRRGRPPGRRAAGRQRKPSSVSAPANVYAYVANGGKRRGRPRKVDYVTAVAPPTVDGGVEVAMVLPAKRRGRPPKIGGVVSKPMKATRGFSRFRRPVGRPRKNVQWTTGSGSRQQDAAGYGELKRKFDFLQEKVRQAVSLLKAEVTSDNLAVVQAIEELEGLTVMDTSEPQGVEEEVQPEEPNPETGAQAEGQQAQAQTEAEAMQEALF